MFSVAFQMLLHKKLRFASTIVAVSVAFFLSAAQIGIMVGWCHTLTAIISHAEVDLWVMAPRTRTFDYATLIPRHRIYQVRTVPDVDWAEGMLISWTFWKSPDGRNEAIELVGLDEDLAGGPWLMSNGRLEDIKQPESVVIDELYCDLLGVNGPGDEVEIAGSRAVVRGTCRGIRTFTASPYVFTTLEQSIRFDARAGADEIMYVLVRCAPGSDLRRVQQAIATQVPHVQVLASDEFALRTIKYWMLETGAGITVVITAVLGLVVSTVIISQTLFGVTNDHVRDYATLLALGHSRRQLMAIVLVQAALLGIVGMGIGSGLFFYAVRATASSTIPIETTPTVYAGVVAVAGACSIVASLLSIRSLFGIDPVTVFHN